MDTQLVQLLTRCYVDNKRTGGEKEIEVLREALQQGDVVRITAALKKLRNKTFLRNAPAVNGANSASLSAETKRTIRRIFNRNNGIVDAMLARVMNPA